MGTPRKPRGATAAPAAVPPADHQTEAASPLKDGDRQLENRRRTRNGKRTPAAAAAASAPPPVESTPPQAIVGIGASAGGLEALRTLVANLPEQSRFSYVIAQHLSPTHQSMLVPLLARETKLKVLDVTEGLAPKPNVIYITPARWNVTLQRGRLHLTEALTPGTPKPSIDSFFSSLAEELGEAAIAIILSGTGSDGARGIREVRAVGGVTFAQDEETAKYTGMPRAAVDSGCVDFVLPPEAIAKRLDATSKLYGSQELIPGPGEVPTVFEQIFELVRQGTGVDFRVYKESTVGRRIRRRMAATDCSSAEEYCELLREQPDEVRRLSQEILISVTSFFRESEAFDALRTIADNIVASKSKEEDIRVWIAGCATGEEAYSIAILFSEAMKQARNKIKIQIFATDIDVDALSRARRGVFSNDNIVRVSPDRTRAYFTVNGQYVQVNKVLREAILFSNHNLVRDPPFLRLDLISCRNVLIYFKPEVQARLLRVFHSALRPGGHLFLGRSESAHAADQLFHVVDERARIFSRQSTHPPLSVHNREIANSFTSRPEKAVVRTRSTLHERVLQAILGNVLPAAVVVDDNLNMVHIFGDVSGFVSVQPGEPNLNLYKLAHPSLRVEIRSMVMRAQRAPRDAVVHAVELGDSNSVAHVGVVSLPREGTDSQQFLIMLRKAESTARQSAPVSAAGAERDLHVRGLEDQLAATREHLQTVVEELETSNEELQSLNEELSSANEELQSANEELETSNEELQSTNEELTTVNEELESKTHELIHLNSDLKNVKDSLNYPLIVLDEHLRVTLFNPQASKLFELSPGSIGQNLFSLPARLNIGEVRQGIEEVISGNSGFEKQFEGDVFHLMYAHPYRDEGLHRKGAVLTFIDNTKLKQAEQRAREFAVQLESSERFAKSIIDALNAHLCVIDQQGIIVAVNSAWSGFIAEEEGTHARCTPGANYVELWKRAALENKSFAAKFIDGLSKVMSGGLGSFSMEYCRTLQDKTQWFNVQVTPFLDTGPQFYVLAHEDITDRVERAHLVMLQSRALDSSMNGIVIADARDHGERPLVYVNRAFEELTGYKKDEALGRDCRFLQGSDRSQPNLGRLRAAMREGREERSLLRNYRKDGSMFWNELSLYPIPDESGNTTYYVGVQRDMTSLVASEEALRSSLEREKLALAFAGVGMFSWDVRGGHINASEIMLKILGIPGASPSLDQTSFRAVVHEEDRPLLDDAIKLCLAGHDSLDVEYRVIWPDGSIHWLHTKGDAENAGSGLPERLLCLSQDITERKASDERIRFIAHHDALTGLPNRTLLRDRLQQVLNSARRNRAKVAVLFIDLDHFKHVNDSLGHHIGDQVLLSVSNRLRALMRDSDTLCRHSGDEYVVVLPQVHDSGEAAHVAEKIVEALSMPHQIAGHELVVTPSVGVSIYPEDGDKIDVLIRNADAAMYHAKGSGRKNFQFFMPEMNEREQDRLTVTTELRRALDRGELQVHYQPQLSVQDGTLVGVEALVRWLHPTRGMIYPNSFIPIAEDYELVLQLGEWVLREACNQAQVWHEAGLPMPPVAVNFSAMQFKQRNVLAKISQALHESQLPPDKLEIELTESAIMHNVQEAADTLTNLHNLGIRLAIDDFGTGYSSLQHLRHFPIDKLKIDRSFISDLPKDGNSASIVRAMISLGQSLKLDVVAEGVETAEQLAFLRAQNCSAFQGHISAPALDAVTFESFVKELPTTHPATQTDASPAMNGDVTRQ